AIPVSQVIDRPVMSASLPTKFAKPPTEPSGISIEKKARRAPQLTVATITPPSFRGVNQRKSEPKAAPTVPAAELLSARAAHATPTRNHLLKLPLDVFVASATKNMIEAKYPRLLLCEKTPCTSIPPTHPPP